MTSSFSCRRRDLGRGLGHLQQQRARAAGRVVHGGVGLVVRLGDAQHWAITRLTSAGVELALAFATLGGEVAHQVLVGVAQDVVAIGAVLREVQFIDSKMPIRLVSLSTFFALAQQRVVVEVGLDAQVVGFFERADDLLLIWSPMSLCPLRATMSAKLAPSGLDAAKGWPAYLSLMYLMNSRTST